MTFRNPKIWLSPVLVIACLVAVPTTVESQCNVSTTLTNMPTMTSSIDVYKILTAPAYCKSTAMNAAFCSPNATGFSTTFLGANAMTATVNPYCNWSCTCGTGAPPHITIDTSDGLPVELMDFSVES